jgi:hypothetical protein
VVLPRLVRKSRVPSGRTADAGSFRNGRAFPINSWGSATIRLQMTGSESAEVDQKSNLYSLVHGNDVYVW